MDIGYKITFHSFWHCGSGLASGADADLLVIKDKDGLPFVPGKTIKGLVKEAVDLLHPCFEGYIDVFGEEGKTRSMSFFSDATLPKDEHQYLSHDDNKHLSKFLYQNISGTTITDGGVADGNTLRKIQVCVPCVLEGKILNVPDKKPDKENSKAVAISDLLVDGLRYIKRLGAWRNRGLGRCTIEIIEPEQKGGES